MIKFRFIDLKDTSKIKLEQEVFDEGPFGEKDYFIRERYVANNYFQILLNHLKTNAYISDFKHEGSKYRIANEIYEIKINNKVYNLIFTIDTYEKNIHLTVSLNNIPMENESNRIEFDSKLEDLKFKIKEFFSKDWKHCIWLVDDQSQLLASELYNEMHYVENLIRELVNEVLTKKFGCGWINIIEFKKIKDEYEGKQDDFKRRVEQFDGVNDILFALNTESLFEIMKIKIYNEYLEFDDRFRKKLHKKIIFNKTEEGLIDILRGNYKIKYDLWEEYFKKLFPENLETIITDFIKNRNHIAHNKLIDFSAYTKIKNNICEMKIIIEKALENCEEIEISHEKMETLQAIHEAEQEEQDVLLNIKQSETGITIRTQKQIFDYLADRLKEFYTALRDEFYFSSSIYLTEFTKLKEHHNKQEIFKIYDNVDENHTIYVFSNISANSGEGETSTLNIVIEQSEKKILEANIQYSNGEVIYNSEQCYYMPYSDSKFDFEEIANFQRKLIEFIKTDMNTLKKEVDYHEYKMKNGESSYVANLYCCNCGEEYVSINEDIYPLGKCINCGEDNELKKCAKCEEYYSEISDGNSMGLCSYCYDKFINE